VCAEDYHADLAAKRVVYCAPQREEEPGGSLLRLLKFAGRGYSAPLDSVAAILARLTADVPSGTEIERAATILTRLREVDPAAPEESVTPTAPPPEIPDEEPPEVNS
jgi:hypothetical protein